MKFEVKGRIILSGSNKEMKKDLENFIEDANKTLLVKGTKDKSEAAKITDWKLEDNIIKIKIKSGRKIRAHDAILRLKNPLSQLLGPKYHIGVRKIKVDECKAIIPRGNPEIEDLPFVASVEVKNDNLIVKFEKLDESELRKHVVDRVIRQATRRKTLTEKIVKAKAGEIVAKSEKRKALFDGDPTEEAIKRGWIKKFPGRGQWFYTPPMAALCRAFESLLIEKVVEPLGFEECLFPKLIPLSIMYKMRYLEGLPEGMYYCSAPKRDPELFKKFKNELIIKKEIPINLLKEGLRDPSYVLAPAQCEPFYEFLSHEVVDKSELPIKFFDRSGWTYRWEAGGAKGLDRVHEFQRIEMVWLGTPEDVEKIRDKTVELSQKLADKLELEWYTEVGDDPFYLEGREFEERNLEFPEIPKYEMKLKGKEDVAVVSANVHGTHFVDGFSIREAHNDRIWTGCTGLGVTRWVYGFLSQKGFEYENWPKLIKNRIKKTKVPKLLTWP